MLLRDYFNSLNFYKNGELSRNQIGRSGVQVKKKNEKFTVVCSRSQQNLKCGHFTLLFCRGRQRNAPKCKTHVQSDCFCSLNLTCFAALSLPPPSSLLKLPNFKRNRVNKFVTFHWTNLYQSYFGCGAVYYALQGGSTFRVCGWNPKVWPFNWKPLNSTFRFYLFESMDEILIVAIQTKSVK